MTVAQMLSSEFLCTKETKESPSCLSTSMSVRKKILLDRPSSTLANISVAALSPDKLAKL